MSYEELGSVLRDTISDSNIDLANRVVSLLKAKIESEVEKTLSVESLLELIQGSNIVGMAIREYFENRVATEIGNRLRCSIYSGTEVDKLFDSIWTEQLDRAIRERMHGRINKFIDSVIAERLNQLKA